MKYLNILKQPFVAAALIFHLLAAWFSIGRYHADEQFQILEFTGYKLGINDSVSLPWEFHEQMRSSTLVFFTYMFIKAMPWIQNPFIQVFILRLCSSLFGLLALFRLNSMFKDTLSQAQYRYLVILSSIYCFIPFFHARYASENISISLFIFGFVLTLNRKSLIIAGLLFGLSYSVRMQSLFLLFGFGLWLLIINKIKWADVIKLSTGFILAVILGLWADKWFYGEWVNTTWNYVYQNIVLGKSKNFGVEPIWFYFEKVLVDGIPPFSLLLIFSFLLLFYFYPKHVLTWTIVPFLIIHFLVSHKELRFLFPLINFIPIACILAFKVFQENQVFSRLKQKIANRNYFYLKPLFLFVNTLLLFFLCLKPADNYTRILHVLYQNYHGITTKIYYQEVDPYNPEHGLNFYKSPFIKTYLLNDSIDLKQLSHQSHTTLITMNNDELFNQLSSKGVHLKLVYNSFPKFLYYFNFNHWIERSRPIKIYEVMP
jgi:GPI mannosyltransferase 3